MSFFAKIVFGMLSLCWAWPAFAIDSYRYLHVNIETPWAIFIFLFGLVFAPMILSVVIYWRYALKKGDAPESETKDKVEDDKHA